MERHDAGPVTQFHIHRHMPRGRNAAFGEARHDLLVERAFRDGEHRPGSGGRAAYDRSVRHSGIAGADPGTAVSIRA
ncbi:hypothetical protein QR77_37995 [Streptomyces sp. 150FB]|uniref:hypothetical protein n=1 Tax=Streptomyces sp. 150FB TaxID=1576605 RepID=UPI00058937EC|nr:hypothetical protein [Streptomyces sp. 150FB]KIF78046.1 hypothetical protein QR77_37995 [Streptomyces sp. 150FB]